MILDQLGHDHKGSAILAVCEKLTPVHSLPEDYDGRPSGHEGQRRTLTLQIDEAGTENFRHF